MARDVYFNQILQRILWSASNHAPELERNRLLDGWEAELYYIPSRREKLFFCLGIRLNSRAIARELDCRFDGSPRLVRSPSFVAMISVLRLARQALDDARLTFSDAGSAFGDDSVVRFVRSVSLRMGRCFTWFSSRDAWDAAYETVFPRWLALLLKKAWQLRRVFGSHAGSPLAPE